MQSLFARSERLAIVAKSTTRSLRSLDEHRLRRRFGIVFPILSVFISVYLWLISSPAIHIHSLARTLPRE